MLRCTDAVDAQLFHGPFAACAERKTVSSTAASAINRIWFYNVIVG